MRQDSTRSGSPSGVPAKQKRGAGYPARPGHFFHKYTRWLAKTCAANFVGADGCWLLTVVAATEDSIRYLRPPSFFNTQLAPLCGCSIDKLSRTRSRCIQEGLLHYEPGGKGIPGIYWVLLPGHVEGLADGPLGELESDFLPQSAEESPRKPRGNPEQNPETSTEPPTLPLPNPSPSKVGEAGGSSIEVTSQSDDWMEAQRQLEAAGVGDSVRAVEAARGKGMTPTTVEAVIAEYRERKVEFKGPAALHWRLTRGCWPVDEQEPGPVQTERQRLEAKHGPKLDAKGMAELQTLCSDAGVPFELEDSRARPESRLRLLTHIDRQTTA